MLLRTDMSMVRAICEVLIRDKKSAYDLMLMLGLNETVDRLAMADSLDWYVDVLREDGHVLRRGLEFKVGGHWKKRCQEHMRCMLV